MIDIHRLLSGLLQSYRSADFPDASSLSTALDMDMSQARITKAKQGNMGVNGARLNGSNVAASLLCGISPRREIWLLFDNSPISYQDIKDEIFGANQRIKPSKLSMGFGVLFEVDDLTCGFTVPSPEGNVDSLFCEEPKPSG